MSMNHSHRKEIIVAVPITVLLLTIGLVAFANAASTSQLTILSVLEDLFYNYDFINPNNPSSTNVDWPVTMIHYDKADVTKVKNIYYGLCPVTCNAFNADLNDGSGWIEDNDRGTKSGAFWSNSLSSYVYIHMRVYAPNPPDYMHNSNWGNYVVSTTHYDQYPSESWSGYSQYAEDDFATIASNSGHAILRNWANFYNAEPYRVEGGNHIWLNDGYATFVDIAL